MKLVDIIREDQPRIGTRKLKYLLHEKGHAIGRDKLFDLLRKPKRLIRPKKNFRKTTYSNHGYTVARNVLKEVEVTAPKQVVVSDITYVRLAGGVFAYLYLLTDRYSRKILGYHVSKDLTHYSALIALDDAIERHFDGDGNGLIHHSDRGCQYCCHEYLKYLKRKNIVPSMTDENHCYQNAVAERVNGILKDEFNLDRVFETFAALKTAVLSAVDTYNRLRPHWSLDLQTPNDVFKYAA